ncbi:MAG TPA: DUF1587 domain-containing protein, partial [Polyangiaceae bacterium]
MRRLFLALVGLAAGAFGCRVEDYEPPDPPMGSAGSGAGGAPVTPPLCQAQASPRAPLALLTRREYDNTIADLLGDVSRPAASFPPENQVQGFNNFTAAHQASPLLVEKYLESAEGIAARAATSKLAELAPCPTGNDMLGCGRSFVRSFGLRAFRRPLETSEALLFDDLFSRTYAQAGYGIAVELVISGMLQSPQFLYRVDTLRTPTPETGAVRLSPYELATDEQIELQARRLLQTPRARDTVRTFHQQWLGLDLLPTISREVPELGVGAQELGAQWLSSFDRFIDHVYWEVGNVGALFSSKRVYLTPKLATLYGVTPTSTDALTSADLPDRSGLLTQPALLAMLAHSDQSAPVLRGVFV